MRIALFVLTVIMLIGIAACIEPIPSDPEPFCGDGTIDTGEQCDDGAANTDACDAAYGASCSYCTSSCESVTVNGGSCGDGTCQAEETASSCSADCGATEQPLDLVSAYAEDGGGFSFASPVSGTWDGVVDGSDATSPGGPVRLVWIRFDLGSIHEVSEVRFFPDSTGTSVSERYYIEWWDGSEWVNFITNEETLSERWYEHAVDVTARHFRITVESDTGGTQFRELEFSGTDTGVAGEPFDVGPTPECTVDSDCASSEMCESGACVTSEAPPPPGDSQTITYTADTTTDFANPERGWYTENVYWGGSAGGDSFPSPVRDVTDDDKPRLELYYVDLSSYRSSSIPGSALAEMEANFQDARDAGIKYVLRYAYNRAGGGNDATLSRMQQHITQLAPYWEANQDVIAVLQGGFSGSWGEMWDGNIDTRSERNAFIETLMANTPEDMMVQWRDPGTWTMYTHPPANRVDRFDGSDVQRMGHYNDCFLAGYEMVTYWNNADHSTQDQFDYVESMAPYVAMGGETCDAYGLNQYNDADYSIERMEAMDWDYLNSEYWMEMYSKWQSSGDLDEISRRLGYRLVLEDATLPTNVAPGASTSLELTMRNDGFGKVYNPRPIELVLDGPIQRRVRLDSDARRELPLGGETRTLRYGFAIPSDLPEGTYSLRLALPDPSSRLEGKSAYAIRLANVGTWRSDGTNDLNANIVIG